MKIELTYDEITDYIRTSYRNELALSYVSPTTICVETDVKVKFIKKHIEAYITLEKIDGYDLYLSYAFPNVAMDILVKGTFPFLQSKLNTNLPLVEKKEGNNLIIHLGKVSQLREALKIIEIDNIGFNSSDVLVAVNFK